MKKLLTILILLIVSIKGFAQFPITLQGNASVQETLNGGAVGVKTGFVWATSFNDTTQANAQLYIKGVTGIVILVNDTLWLRNHLANRWIPVGSGGGGGSVSAKSGASVSGGFVVLVARLFHSTRC
jgi:hypothetical protein